MGEDVEGNGRGIIFGIDPILPRENLGQNNLLWEEI
jgi:hypothetical protein